MADPESTMNGAVSRHKPALEEGFDDLLSPNMLGSVQHRPMGSRLLLSGLTGYFTRARANISHVAILTPL